MDATRPSTKAPRVLYSQASIPPNKSDGRSMPAAGPSKKTSMGLYSRASLPYPQFLSRSMPSAGPRKGPKLLYSVPSLPPEEPLPPLPVLAETVPDLSVIYSIEVSHSAPTKGTCERITEAAGVNHREMAHRG